MQKGLLIIYNVLFAAVINMQAQLVLLAVWIAVINLQFGVFLKLSLCNKFRISANNIHTYHSRVIPEGVAEVSQIFL
jgi:hypothetical protein